MHVLYDKRMPLPGRAHIPRNCEHSTMDRGNLGVKSERVWTHRGLFFHFWTNTWTFLYYCVQRSRWHSPGDVEGSQLLLADLLVRRRGVKLCGPHGFTRSAGGTPRLRAEVTTINFHHDIVTTADNHVYLVGVFQSRFALRHPTHTNCKTLRSCVLLSHRVMNHRCLKMYIWNLLIHLM